MSNRVWSWGNGGAVGQTSGQVVALDDDKVVYLVGVFKGGGSVTLPMTREAVRELIVALGASVAAAPEPTTTAGNVQ